MEHQEYTYLLYLAIIPIRYTSFSNVLMNKL